MTSINKGKLYKRFEKMRLINVAKHTFDRWDVIKTKKKHKAMVRNGYKLELPTHFVYEVTSRCNLSCKMCIVRPDLRSNAPHLELEQIKNIFSDINVKRITLTGGEPFLRRDFFDVLDFFKNSDIVISTNGVLINEDLAKRVSRKRLQGVNISVDGTEEIHNIIRGSPVAFKRTTEALRLLSKNNNHYLGIVCVITDENFDTLEQLIPLAKSLGVSHISFEFERRITDDELKETKEMLGPAFSNIEVGVNNNDPKYSLEELKEKIKILKRTGKEQDVGIHFIPIWLEDNLEEIYSKTIRKNHKLSCKSMFVGRVHSMGELHLCPMIRKSFGSLLEKPFKRLWNCEELCNVRKIMTENNLSPACSQCLYVRL